MIVALALVGGLALPAAVVGLPRAEPAPALNPCRGVDRCVEYAQADVTGDGIPDRIGYRWKPKDLEFSPKRHTVTVVVTAGGGGRYTYAARQFGYFEGTYGAAPMDGVPGAEIALSWLPGAHTSVVQVITFRRGALVREKSWYRDGGATYGSGAEWIPGESAEAPIMRECKYDDIPLGNRPNFQTSTADFTWQVDRWVKGPESKENYPAAEQIPWQCMRFSVPGMARAPRYVGP